MLDPEVVGVTLPSKVMTRPLSPHRTGRSVSIRALTGTGAGFRLRRAASSPSPAAVPEPQPPPFAAAPVSAPSPGDRRRPEGTRPTVTPTVASGKVTFTATGTTWARGRRPPHR